MLVSTLDLYKIIVRIYRQLLPDTNSQFTTKLIQSVLEEYNKRTFAAKKEMLENQIKLNNLKHELQSMKNNKVVSEREVSFISEEIREQDSHLTRSKYEYFRPLKKAVYMLDSVLGMI